MSVLTLPYTLPDHQFAEVRLRPQKKTARTTSPFSFHSQVFIHEGHRWMAEVTLPLKSRADAEAWLAALSELVGGVGEIHLGDPAGASPRGTWDTSDALLKLVFATESYGQRTGTVQVDGGSQTGQTLNVKGLAIDAQSVAKAGDYFELGSGTSRRLYKLAEDADSDDEGKATLKFWPRLRESPANNDPVTVSDTRGTFELPQQEFGWTWQPPSLTRITFRAIEAI